MKFERSFEKRKSFVAISILIFLFLINVSYSYYFGSYDVNSDLNFDLEGNVEGFIDKAMSGTTFDSSQEIRKYGFISFFTKLNSFEKDFSSPFVVSENLSISVENRHLRVSLTTSGGSYVLETPFKGYSWTFVAFEIANGEVNLYLDGELVDSSTFLGNFLQRGFTFNSEDKILDEISFSNAFGLDFFDGYMTYLKDDPESSYNFKREIYLDMLNLSKKNFVVSFDSGLYDFYSENDGGNFYTKKNGKYYLLPSCDVNSKKYVRVLDARSDEGEFLLRINNSNVDFVKIDVTDLLPYLRRNESFAIFNSDFKKMDYCLEKKDNSCDDLLNATTLSDSADVLGHLGPYQDMDSEITAVNPLQVKIKNNGISVQDYNFTIDLGFVPDYNLNLIDSFGNYVNYCYENGLECNSTKSQKISFRIPSINSNETIEIKDGLFAIVNTSHVPATSEMPGGLGVNFNHNATLLVDAQEDLRISDNVSILFSMNMNSSLEGQRGDIICNHDSGYLGYCISKEADDTLTFYPADGISWNPLTSDPLESEKWYQIAAVSNLGRSNIYIDGNLNVQAEGVDLKPSFDNNLTIGAQNISQFFFKGLLDDLRIYNRSLSSEEIKACNLDDSLCPEDHLVLHYNFDECIDKYGAEVSCDMRYISYVRDLSGNSNHGKLNGNISFENVNSRQDKEKFTVKSKVSSLVNASDMGYLGSINTNESISSSVNFGEKIYYFYEGRTQSNAYSKNNCADVFEVFDSGNNLEDWSYDNTHKEVLESSLGQKDGYLVRDITSGSGDSTSEFFVYEKNLSSNYIIESRTYSFDESHTFAHIFKYEDPLNYAWLESDLLSNESQLGALISNTQYLDLTSVNSISSGWNNIKSVVDLDSSTLKVYQNDTFFDNFDIDVDFGGGNLQDIKSQGAGFLTYDGDENLFIDNFYIYKNSNSKVKEISNKQETDGKYFDYLPAKLEAYDSLVFDSDFSLYLPQPCDFYENGVLKESESYSYQVSLLSNYLLGILCSDYFVSLPLQYSSLEPVFLDAYVKNTFGSEGFYDIFFYTQDSRLLSQEKLILTVDSSEKRYSYSNLGNLHHIKFESEKNSFNLDLEYNGLPILSDSVTDFPQKTLTIVFRYPGLSSNYKGGKYFLFDSKYLLLNSDGFLNSSVGPSNENLTIKQNYKTDLMVSDVLKEENFMDSTSLVLRGYNFVFDSNRYDLPFNIQYIGHKNGEDYFYVSEDVDNYFLKYD